MKHIIAIAAAWLTAGFAAQTVLAQGSASAREAASYRTLPGHRTPEADRLAADIVARRVDPLELLRQLSPHVRVPPGAVYDAKCSVELSVSRLGSMVKLREISAAFTLGHERPEEYTRFMQMSEAERAAVDPVDQDDWMRWGGPLRSRPGGKAFHGAVAFYNAAGFRRGIVYIQVPFVAPSRATEPLLEATVWPTVPFAECVHLPTGPMIVMQLK